MNLGTFEGSLIILVFVAMTGFLSLLVRRPRKTRSARDKNAKNESENEKTSYLR